MALELLAEGKEFEVCDTQLTGVADGDPEVFYRIRTLDPRTHKKIVKTHTKMEPVRGIGRVEKIDSHAAAEDIFDYVLVGWRGVNLAGVPAPCTRELKLAGLDFTRRAAIVELAGMNEIVSVPERRAESFPTSA
jgi:hypothetical protein